MDVIWVLIGLALLIGGGELLVRGAASLALRFRIPPLVIGLTIVSFSTSAPELFVSLKAALAGHPDMAVGNVVGSNLSNIGLILGVTALFFGFDVQMATFRRDWLFLMLFTIVYLILLLDGSTALMDGSILLAILGAYILLLLSVVRKNRRSGKPTEDSELADPLWRSLLFLILGIAGLKFGADSLVKGSVGLAKDWGVSDRVISVTVVSIGTSLPELAASLVSAFRGEREISLGNIIGSNIFNIGSVIGLSSLVIPIVPHDPQVLRFDYPWMIGMTLLIPIMLLIGKRYRISKWQGAVFLLGYAAYILSIFY